MCFHIFFATATVSTVSTQKNLRLQKGTFNGDIAHHIRTGGNPLKSGLSPAGDTALPCCQKPPQGNHSMWARQAIIMSHMRGEFSLNNTEVFLQTQLKIDVIKAEARVLL